MSSLDLQELWEKQDVIVQYLLHFPRCLIVLMQDYLIPRVSTHDMYWYGELKTLKVPKRRRSFGGITKKEQELDKKYSERLIMEHIPRLFFHERGERRLWTLDDVSEPYCFVGGNVLPPKVWKRGEYNLSWFIQPSSLKRRRNFALLAPHYLFRKDMDERENKRQDVRVEIIQIERDLSRADHKFNQEYKTKATVLKKEYDKNIKNARDPMWVKTEFDTNISSLKKKTLDERDVYCKNLRKRYKELDPTYRDGYF